ncbi:MAG: hypothetical protein WCJ75_11405, partial [Desulfomonile sp.]
MAPKKISAATNRNPLQQNESLTWNLMLGSERNPSFSSIQYYEQTYNQILQDEIFTVKIFPHQFVNPQLRGADLLGFIFISR